LLPRFKRAEAQATPAGPEPTTQSITVMLSVQEEEPQIQFRRCRIFGAIGCGGPGQLTVFRFDRAAKSCYQRGKLGWQSRRCYYGKVLDVSDKPLKMVTCSHCEAKVFIQGDLPPLATEPCKRCGHSIMMPMQLRQFELLSKIASGGQGKVYKAWDTVLQRHVAVKLMRKELENDPVALDAFYHEARACASLNHTNIIHIYSFDELDGQRYLVMELADHGSLDARIEKQQRLP